MRQTRSSARLSRATKTEPDEKTDPLMFDKLESSPPPKAEKHESDFDDSKDDEDEFEDKETSAPKRKRARTTRRAKPAPRTKHVRGKQGRLAGLMKMPVDIFTEITRHLFPKDIITLSRSNKFFRQLLMNKSAIHIWHAAMRNVPGIPLCPPDLSEPHYLALIYAHNCSMCGTTASRRMDEMLRARLCPSCRSSSLVNTITLPLEVRSLVLSSSKIIPTKRRWGFDLYAFKSEVTEVQNRLDEFAISGDSTGLAAWKAARSEELDTRRKQALELTLFLDEMEENRESKLSDLKKRRREDINNRLLGMGWEAEDLVIRYPRNREWSSLVDQPKVLTDRTWANLQPKLIPILEANRQDRLQRERDQRKRDRRVRLTSHLTEIKDAREPILDVTIAPFAIPGSSASSSSAPSTYKVIHKGIFPDIVDALEWDRMKEFLEDDLPVEAMEAEVEQHLPELRQRASQWTVDIQDHLAALLREGYIEDGLGSDLPDASLSGPEGTDDLLENVSPNLKILLRADSLFQSTKSKLRPPLVYDAAVADTYPAPSYDLFSMEFRSKQPVDISKCKRHVEAQQAARKLLEYLGKPNATFLEMRTGIGYRCGRCQVHGVYTWEEIVDHFASKQQAWENVQQHEAALARRGVTFRNVHDAAFETDKPLIKRLTTDEPNFDLGDMNGLVSLNDKVCRVCSGVAFLPEVRMSQQGMIAHLMDVHNISQPTSPEHYTPALWITDMFDGINDYGDSVFWAPSYDWSSDDGMDIFDEFGW